MYAAALPLADRLELTFVDAEPDGDTLFPAVDWEEWRELRREHGDGCDARRRTSADRCPSR